MPDTHRAVLATTSIPEKGDSTMRMYDMARLKIGEHVWTHGYRPFLARLTPEARHNAVNRHIISLQGYPAFLQMARRLWRSSYADISPTIVCGQRWSHNVGVGPGIDKNGEQIAFWNEIAGSEEIGGVTPRPQDGRPEPRLFVEYLMTPDGRTIIVVNRMGYPSHGAPVVSARLGKVFEKNPDTIPIIVQLAPNTETVARYTASGDPDILIQDYIDAAEPFMPILRPGKDYISIGISPNTRGLREFFIIHYEEFAEKIRRGIERLACRYIPPTIYKMPPFVDLGISEDAFETMVVTIARYAQGIAGTNTFSDPAAKKRFGITEEGGVSAHLLYPYALQTQMMISRVITKHRLELDLVALGGIMSGDQAHDVIMASFPARPPAAIQLVSWITQDGPLAIHKALKGIHTQPI